MSPDELRIAGEALFGLRWRAPLARALGVSNSTVLRWEAGTNAIPKMVGLALNELERWAPSKGGTNSQ